MGSEKTLKFLGFEKPGWSFKRPFDPHPPSCKLLVTRSVPRPKETQITLGLVLLTPLSAFYGDGEADIENGRVQSLSFGFWLCRLFMDKVHIYLLKDPA